MFISGKVTTNLDEYRSEKWPSVFVEIPRIGSYIKSSSGKLLKVVRITHCIESPVRIPYIEIEVNN